MVLRPADHHLLDSIDRTSPIDKRSFCIRTATGSKQDIEGWTMLAVKWPGAERTVPIAAAVIKGNCDKMATTLLIGNGCETLSDADKQQLGPAAAGVPRRYSDVYTINRKFAQSEVSRCRRRGGKCEGH